MHALAGEFALSVSTFRPVVPALVTRGRAAQMRSLSEAAAPVQAASRFAMPCAIHSIMSVGGLIVQTAPPSREWRQSAPDNLRFVDPRDAAGLLDEPDARTLIVSDDRIAEPLIRRWRDKHPGGELTIVRRGTSLDNIDLQACRDLDVTVLNTPGVNSVHVARYLLEHMRAPGGELPRDVRLLGCGSVGVHVARSVCESGGSVIIPTNVRRSAQSLGLSQFADRVALASSWEEAFSGGRSVVICVPLTTATKGRVGAAHIESLAKGCAIHNVAKPDVFSDDALHALSESGHRMHIDYGPATLREFAARLERLGIPPGSWRVPPLLTSAAMRSAAHDMDLAVNLVVATETLRRLTDADLSKSWAIAPRDAGARETVHVRGAGVVGLFQQVGLLSEFDVVGHGSRASEEGPSHKPVDMRHLSPTETTAVPVYPNEAVYPFAARFVEMTNLCGMALVKALVRDNESLRPFFHEGLVRAFPESISEAEMEATIEMHKSINERRWPGQGPSRAVVEIPGHEFERRYGIPGIRKAIEAPGYHVQFTGLMDELTRLLAEAGVKSTGRRLDDAELASLPGAPLIVSSRGVQEPGTVPVVGWFYKAPIEASELARMNAPVAEGEAQRLRGIKLQYPMRGSLGVMNCSVEDGYLLVSGGLAWPESTAEEAEAVRAQFLKAVEEHFPETYRQARESGSEEVIACARPGTRDGLPIIRRISEREIAAGGNFKGGATQAKVMATVVRAMVEVGAASARRAQVEVENAKPVEAALA